MERIKGYDASHWNGKPDWLKAKEHGIEWVYVKAGEIVPKTGKEFIDGQYQRNIQKLKEADLISGAYYYVHPKVGASIQARAFERVMKNLGKPDLPPIIDLEDSDGWEPKDVAYSVQVIVERLEDDLNVRPIIYTSNSFWTSKVGAPDWGKDYSFIIAQYPSKEVVTDMDKFPYKQSPVNAKIADNVVAWQFSDNTKLAGMPRLDGNFWLKGREMLYELAGKMQEQPQPKKPEQEEPTQEIDHEMYNRCLEIWNKSHIEMNSVWWKIRSLGR